MNDMNKNNNNNEQLVGNNSYKIGMKVKII